MNTEPTTYGELKALVAKTPRGDWPSRVNSSLTRSQALDIFEAALKDHADNELVSSRITGGLMMRNILRECRSRV